MKELTPEQRVLQELVTYLDDYQEMTKDYAPGNRYWGQKLQDIVERARTVLTAHTEPESEPMFESMDDVFGDLPPRTDWQELRMAFTIWRCNLKGRIRNWLDKDGE